ncbi:hypothetical protein Vadar_015679 [Vaccinium darrowii]|uniref:Uncharacterized protein n=1 Tax=Vaccinium darrowii TaxID=229202 RepID=A0ACB7Z460_9ERIC|nr:hypothetical protein Vadar_015679 [Vaccinium darrowii]
MCGTCFSTSVFGLIHMDSPTEPSGRNFLNGIYLWPIGVCAKDEFQQDEGFQAFFNFIHYTTIALLRNANQSVFHVQMAGKVKTKHSSRHHDDGWTIMAEKLGPRGKRGNGGEQKFTSAPDGFVRAFFVLVQQLKLFGVVNRNTIISIPLVDFVTGPPEVL